MVELNWKRVWKHVKNFFNSAFLQTIAIIIVEFLAYNVALKQNNLTAQLSEISHSPAFNEPLKISTFKTDIKVENVSRVSLHNLQLEVIDLYVNPSTIIHVSNTDTMVYDLEPGA